jgi:hypothetical protein
MSWQTLLTSPGGRVTEAKIEGDDITIRTQQNVDAILDHNHDLRSLDDRGWVMGKDMRRVASIPMAVVYKWLVEDGIDVFSGEDQDRVAKKLNDPDYAYLRTAPGRLGPVGDGTYR